MPLVAIYFRSTKNAKSKRLPNKIRNRRENRGRSRRTTKSTHVTMPTLREAVSYNHWVCLPLNSTTKGQRKRIKVMRTLTALMRSLQMKEPSEMTALGTTSPSASQCEAITAVTCS